MRKVFLFLWLLLPAAAGAYHYGPGQDRLRADDAAAAAERAEAASKLARETAARDGDDAAREHWAEAEAAYTEALELLPADRVAESRALRLERAKAQMFISQMPQARRDLQALVDELQEDPTADPAQLASARGALANAQYYMTWLMRLEGEPREDWEREIDASRQNYKLLAEDAARAGDSAQEKQAQEDLESAIRLARMDLDELQGLPLPSQ